MSQLALPLKLQDHAVFDSFLPDGNEVALSYLQALLNNDDGPGMWLSGLASTGKTHLLQAFCDRAEDNAQYLPLRDLAPLGPGILEGVAQRKYVCIDDVDTVTGLEAWELALFGAYNAITDAGGIIVCSASVVPNDCDILLPDLASRFVRLPVFQLRLLSDAQQIAALQLRARHRGLELPDETARYLLSRKSRDMAHLYGLLDRLDTEALIAQRRLTIPFVKNVLGGERVDEPGA